MNIVVLAGGLSPERNVSLCSGNLVCGALRKKGHNAIIIDAFLGIEIDRENGSKNIEELFLGAKDKKMPKVIVEEKEPDLDEIKKLIDPEFLAGNMEKTSLTMPVSEDKTGMNADVIKVGESGKLEKAIFIVYNE